MVERVLIRGDPLHAELPEGMKFRMHYEGPLLAANGEPRDGQADRRTSGDPECQKPTLLRVTTGVPKAIGGISAPPRARGPMAGHNGGPLFVRRKPGRLTIAAEAIKDAIFSLLVGGLPPNAKHAVNRES